MKLPSVQAVNDKRVEKFLGRITDTMASGEAGEYRSLVERYESEHNVPMADIAAALAHMVQGDTPLLLAPDRVMAKPAFEATGYDQRRSERPEGNVRPGRSSEHATPRNKPPFERQERPQRSESFDRQERPQRSEAVRPGVDHSHAAQAPRSFDPPARETSRIERPQFERPHTERPQAPRPHSERTATERPHTHSAPRDKPDVGMESFRIEVGHAHGVKPANIVGAIANEAGLDSKYIGRIDIQDDYTVLDLPEGMPKELLMHLKKVWVSGQQLRIHKLGEGDAGGDTPPRKFKPAAARTGAKPSGFKPGPPGKLHRKGPPKPRE